MMVDKKSEDIDWMVLGAAERVEPTKLLYKALRAVSDITGREVDLLMDDAYGEPNTTSSHYASNFRRGNVAAGKAMMIHRWLEENYFATAQIAAPELFQANPKSAWESFVEANAITGNVRIVRLKSNATLIERDEEVIEVDHTLRLTQRFCFQLSTEIRGAALAFQKYEQKWHNLSIGPDSRNLKGSVKSDPQFLPLDTGGKPVGLRENNDAGRHEFVIIVSEGPNLPADMRKLAQLKQGELTFEVHKIAVKFVT
jgi:hypothetical protein